MKKLVCGMAIATTLLTGCGEKKEVASQDQNGKQTMRFAWWGGKERHEATLKVIEMFKAKNPDIEILPEYSGYDGYLQKLTTQLAGSNAPDLIQVDRAWLNDFANMGGNLFVDLESEKNIDLGNFDSNFLKETSYMQEKLVGIPMGVASRTWMYNDKNIEAAGLNVDELTWDNIFEISKEIRKANPKGYAVGIIPKDAMRIILEYAVQSTGKNLFTEDNKIAMRAEELQIGADYFKKLVDAQVIPPLSETVIYNDKPGDNPKVINGDYTFLPTWSSALANYSFSEGKIHFINYPILKGATNTGIEVRPSMLMAINEKSKNKDAAAKFMNYLVTDEEAIKVLKDLRGIPASKKANEVLAKNSMINAHQLKAVEEGIKYKGNTINALLDNPEIEMIYNYEIQKLWSGEKTPQKVSEDMIKEMGDKLNELFKK
ncbi:MAG: ABC transporter substrate-binding protein [Cetobacterium sp.]